MGDEAAVSSSDDVAALAMVTGGAGPWVWAIQQPSALPRGVGAGWDLIVPAGWGMPLWLALQVYVLPLMMRMIFLLVMMVFLFLLLLLQSVGFLFFF